MNAEIQDLAAALLAGLKTVLDAKLYGVYLFGALTFPDGGAVTDIDFHVILNDGLTEDEKAGLDRLDAALARDYPPLGADLDGYYILLAETHAMTPPRHQRAAGIVDGSWALHCAHIRAGRCIVLHGPDPKTIYPEPAWPDLADALAGELAWLEAHLVDAPAYCALNLCRLLYSCATRDVVISKYAAAGWAQAAFPGWRHLIAAALSWYAGTATEAECAAVQAGVCAFHAYARPQIARVVEAGTNHIRAASQATVDLI